MRIRTHGLALSAAVRLACAAALPACAAVLFACAPAAQAGQLLVEALDRHGASVPDVAFYAEPAAPAQALADRPIAVMDQRARAFVPHVLVAQTGTEIQFPNSDSVSHHVYSFSPAKTFELPLYKQGTIHPPLRFEEAGVVTLGCNIHDDMVGYILIVSTPYFAVTGTDGRAALERLPPGRYRIHAWTPRLRPASLPAARDIEVGAASTTRLTTRFEAKLLPSHRSSDSGLQWSDY